MNKFLFLALCSTLLHKHALHPTVFLESSRQAGSVNLSQPCIGYLALEDVIISSRLFKQRLEYLIEHPLIVGIILTINSGGGSSTASWEMYDALRRACEKKPIVSYIEEVCASGAYLAACATNVIVANSMALVGSIGVVQTIEKIEPTQFKQNGLKGNITIHRFKKGKFKQLGSPYDPMTEEDQQQLEQGITRLHHQFCADVAAQRGLTHEEVAAQESLTFTGLEALDLGLIDQIGNFDDALAALSQELAARDLTCKDTLAAVEELKHSMIFPPGYDELSQDQFGLPFDVQRIRYELAA